MRIPAAALALFLATSVSLADDDIRAVIGGPQARATPSARPADLIRLGQTLPSKVLEVMKQSRKGLVAAIYEASRQAGRTVTAGTLQQIRSDGFRYTPAPRDRLVVRRSNGEVHTFRLKSARGNTRAASADDFLDANHALEWEHSYKKYTLRITVQTRGGRWSFHGKGSVLAGNRRFHVDLQGSGTSYFESSYGGAERKHNYQLRGEAKSADMALSINEQHRFQLVSYRGSAASSSGSTINSELRIAGGTTYRWSNCRINRSFKNGSPVRVNREWGADGKVLRNGQAYGAMRLTRGQRGINIVIATPDGNIVLQSFN